MSMPVRKVEAVMGHPRYTKEQIAMRGKAIYEQEIRAQLEPRRNGQYLVINVETGEYEIDEDERTVSQRAYARHPGAPLYGMRIGCEAWGRIGWRGLTGTPCAAVVVAVTRPSANSISSPCPGLIAGATRPNGGRSKATRRIRNI